MIRRDDSKYYVIIFVRLLYAPLANKTRHIYNTHVYLSYWYVKSSERAISVNISYSGSYNNTCRSERDA